MILGKWLCPRHGGNRVDSGTCDAITDSGRECGRRLVEYVPAMELRELVKELSSFIPYERPEQGPLPAWIGALRDRAHRV